MDYSLSIPVIVMVALAEELLASVWLVVSSLSGMPISATEIPVSFKPNRTDANRRIAKVIKKTGLFTSTSSQSNISYRDYGKPSIPITTRHICRSFARATRARQDEEMGWASRAL